MHFFYIWFLHLSPWGSCSHAVKPSPAIAPSLHPPSSPRPLQQLELIARSSNFRTALHNSWTTSPESSRSVEARGSFKTSIDALAELFLALESPQKCDFHCLLMNLLLNGQCMEFHFCSRKDSHCRLHRIRHRSCFPTVFVQVPTFLFQRTRTSEHHGTGRACDILQLASNSMSCNLILLTFSHHPRGKIEFCRTVRIGALQSTMRFTLVRCNSLSNSWFACDQNRGYWRQTFANATFAVWEGSQGLADGQGSRWWWQNEGQEEAYFPLVEGRTSGTCTRRKCWSLWFLWL